jgi:hypothetical protein
MLLSYFNVQYTNAYFYWSLLNIFGYLYTNQTYILFSYEIVEFRIQELFEPLFKEKW